MTRSTCCGADTGRSGVMNDADTVIEPYYHPKALVVRCCGAGTGESERSICPEQTFTILGLLCFSKPRGTACRYRSEITDDLVQSVVMILLIIRGR